MKDLLKNVWFNWVITTLFERIPVIKKVFEYADGNKTKIGRIVMAIAAILTFAVSPQGICNLFADWCAAHPEFNDYVLKVLAGLGWLITELGLQHKTAKQLAEEGVVEDYSI